MVFTSTATVELDSDSSSDAIWNVLSDGWTYASWVVGTSRVRAVDPHWPQPGARLHHSFGVWPLVINDHTEVLELDAGRRIRLQARGWPTGEATVEITTSPTEGSSTRLTIEEDVTSGPARLLPKPFRQAATVPRNRETLRRLSLLASGRPA
jgi:hypothetical protein